MGVNVMDYNWECVFNPNDLLLIIGVCVVIIILLYIYRKYQPIKFFNPLVTFVIVLFSVVTVFTLGIFIAIKTGIMKVG